MKLAYGFALPTKCCLHAPFPPPPAVVTGGSENTGGPASKALDSCGGHAMLPARAKCSECPGLWHSQLECLHQKTAGTEGTSSTPPEFLLSVTFSSGF